MTMMNERLTCKWCVKKGQCDSKCPYYSAVSRIDAEDDPSPSKIQELAFEIEVYEAMCQQLIVVTPETSMLHVREILRKNHVSGLPVVDDGKLLGIINLENFITCILNGGINETVRKNMTLDVKTLYADEPLIYAVRNFELSESGRFPVLARDTGKLVGMITKGDVIKCLLEKLHVHYHEDEIHKYRASHIFEDIQSANTTLTLRYTIQGGDHRHAGKQSGNLKTNLSRLGIAPKILRRLTVASCEAEMNIIVFTGGGELIAQVEEDKITINAIDNGPGISDIEKAMEMGYSTAPDWVREMGFGAGMGLPNIKSCSDEMRIDSTVGKGTNLEFVVYLKR